MAVILLALALLVATASAVRGIWSPCGLSMLSSITPMTESGRGHRFGVTAAWFVVGGAVGGLCLGALAATGAAGLSAAGLSLDARMGIGAVVALLTAGIDLGVFGVELPIFKRQVDDAWLRRYRGWAYGAGFGWQIGFGVATYIMTAGIFLTIALAVLTASAAQALLVGAVFGVVRGSAVYVGRSASSPAALARVHERLDAVGPYARTTATGVQVVAAALLASTAWHPLAGLVVVAALVAAWSLARGASTQPARS